MSTKILLDTDIGTDADDAVCLSYLLWHPDAEILGITTVGHDAVRRAAIARRLCDQYGAPEIPIAAGADQPFFANPFWLDHQINQDGILAEPPPPGPARPADALRLMRETIHAHPGEVVVVTIGMLTNLALLAATEPETVARVGAVHSMVGRRNEDRSDMRPECNGMLDPAATGAVFQRSLPNHAIVPLGTGRGLALSGEQVASYFAGDTLEPLRACCHGWEGVRKQPGVGVHDPITAATLLHPELCAWERGRMGIELNRHDPKTGEAFADDAAIGTTYFDPEPAGPHWVAGPAKDGEAFHRNLEATLAPAR